MRLPDALLLNDEANNTGPVSSEVEGAHTISPCNRHTTKSNRRSLNNLQKSKTENEYPFSWHRLDL